MLLAVVLAIPISMLLLSLSPLFRRWRLVRFRDGMDALSTFKLVGFGPNRDSGYVKMLANPIAYLSVQSVGVRRMYVLYVHFTAIGGKPRRSELTHMGRFESPTRAIARFNREIVLWEGLTSNQVRDRVSGLCQTRRVEVDPAPLPELATR